MTTYRFLVEIESESPWVADDIDYAINLAHHDEIERHDIEVKVFHVTLHYNEEGRLAA